ncbi:hypothetical protein SLEP1_g46454 [Rubroshorea leprosula]|uniref:Uncharacterized protein n=1 Tax=Rubroshorea leprosula TaxID=152421 RepID=A0AAV5LME2_9ROSI|nr:hypothetical protein SLEP1_g46454 [Rubroshorea leprosula]
MHFILFKSLLVPSANVSSDVIKTVFSSNFRYLEITVFGIGFHFPIVLVPSLPRSLGDHFLLNDSFSSTHSGTEALHASPFLQCFGTPAMLCQLYRSDSCFNVPLSNNVLACNSAY